MPNNNIKVSEMDSAEQINTNDLLMVTQQDAEVESIYDSKKASVEKVAKKIVNEIQFTNNLETTNKTITGAINEAAAVGKLSGGYTSIGFTSDYSSIAEDSQWKDSGSTVDGHKVYRSAEVDFGTSGGDLLCTITVEGYNGVTFYFKQTSSDTEKAYLVLGNGIDPINLDPDHSVYEKSFKGYSSNTWLEYTVGGQYDKYQILYHVEPNSGELTAGQGFVYVVPGEATTAGGEIFNNYNNNVGIGINSHAEGENTRAYGSYTHAEGYNTIAAGSFSHAEGEKTIAFRNTSHAEGQDTQARGSYSHAEGYRTIASGAGAHAEGCAKNSDTYIIASGQGSHAEGCDTQATNWYAHAEGDNTLASGISAHAEGRNTKAPNEAAHAEGIYTEATGQGAHAEGFGSNASGKNIASGQGSHAEGFLSRAYGDHSHAEGGQCQAHGHESHVEGGGTYAYGAQSHAEGAGNYVFGDKGHVEGAGNVSTKEGTHVEGTGNFAHIESHIEGSGNKNSSQATHSHTEGAGNLNWGHQSHVEGSGNNLSGEEAHVEGAGNRVYGAKSHGEGGGNFVYGISDHAEGKHNTIIGHAHHAEGMRNFVGINSEITEFEEFAYGTTYDVGDIVCVNSVLLNYIYDINDENVELNNDVLFECVSEPGQIQASENIEIITPTSWNSSTAYAAGSVVKFSQSQFMAYYFCSSAVAAGTQPEISSSWTRITTFLSPFKSATVNSGYYLLSPNSEFDYSMVNVAKVTNTIEFTAMWEPLTHTKVAHIEGFGNIALGDYQHVQGKYNTPDAQKAFIIGNGSKTEGVITRSNAMTVDWNGNITLGTGGDITVGIPLSTTASTLGAAINEIVAGGGGGGSSTLAGLTDVSITTPSNDDVLKYDSTSQKWVSGVGGGSGSSTLVGLTDVSVTTPSNGQALVYDSTSAKWVNGYGGTGPSTLAALSDVSFTTPSDKQSLVYDSQNQIWKNAAINYNDISNTPSLAPVAISGDYTDLSNTPTIWTDVTGTLIAGQTSITLSNVAITTSSTIDYYTDTFGVNPTNVSVVSGSVTLTFEAQSTDLGVKVRVS